MSDYVKCGGCGNADPEKVCIGCLHDFDPPVEGVDPKAMEAAEEAFWTGITEVRQTGTIVGLSEGISKAILAYLSASPSVQCCMCGKTGISTKEGDGGPECELADGRWVCSAECYDQAVDPALSTPIGEAAGEAEPVAWMFPHMLWPKDERQFSATDPGDVAGKVPLYAHPAPSHQSREAVIEECAKAIDQLVALLGQQLEVLDISREASAYGIAARAVRALKGGAS